FIFIMIYLKLPIVISGVLSIGSLTFLMQMFDSVIRYTQAVNEQILTLLDDSKYAEDYFELTSLPPLIKEKKPGHEIAISGSPKIQFQNVSFEYPMERQRLKKYRSLLCRANIWQLLARTEPVKQL